MAHREPVEVVFADVDMMGHVNNATYFTYLETARTKYFLELKDRGPPYEKDELDFIVAKASCEYRRGLTWGERCTVVVWPSAIGTTSFTLAYEVRDASGAVAAYGETVVVTYDYAKGAKKPI